MIRKLNELNKKRKEVLKFIDISKIDFSSRDRIIPLEAVKCNREKWILAKTLGREFNFSSRKYFFKANSRMFKDENKINIALVEFLEELANEIKELCIDYYYFIQDSNIPLNRVSAKLGNKSKWNSFFNHLFYLSSLRRRYAPRKTRIEFLLKIDDVLRKLIKE